MIQQRRFSNRFIKDFVDVFCFFFLKRCTRRARIAAADAIAAASAASTADDAATATDESFLACRTRNGLVLFVL